jgi:uncharacterized protein (TIGR02453 family)
MEFTGFPVAALDFYDDLETDNTRSFWEAHREVWEKAVREPMLALTGALAAEFGPAKVFRPYRDLRYAARRGDTTPYKTHQGAFVAADSATGWYVEVAAPGVRVGAGFYDASRARLGSIRAAIGDDHDGTELERILRSLERRGWTRSGDTLRTAPRGWPADHPRIDLLRHRSLAMGRSYGFDEVIIHTPALLHRVRRDWRAARPVVEWLVRATESVDDGALR